MVKLQYLLWLKITDNNDCSMKMKNIYPLLKIGHNLFNNKADKRINNKTFLITI